MSCCDSSHSDSSSEREPPVAYYSQPPPGAIPVMQPGSVRVVSYGQQERRVSRSQSANAYSFRASITPVSMLKTPYTGHNTMVEFTIRRKDNTVFLQWEPFSCILGAKGIMNLEIHQTLPSPPPFPISGFYNIIYNGRSKISKMIIDPYSITPIIFRLDLVDISSETNVGDSVTIDGGCIFWITMT